MPTKKYDWYKIKLDFMASEYLDLIPFLRSVFGEHKDYTTGVWHKNTVGWAKEKQAIMKIAQQRAMDAMVKDLEKMYKPSTKELGEMHKAIINLMKAGIQAEVDICFDKKTGQVKESPNVKSLKSLWEMVKAEKEEPTQITTAVPLTDEDKKMIDDVLDNNL